jgi:transposase
VTKLISEITLGIDVAKDQLVICDWRSGELTSLVNQPAPIHAWLRTLPGPVRLALEPTSHYHRAVVAAAVALGHTVYLVNPRQLAHYREAVNVRHKTDPEDAWLLARYLAHEGAALRPFTPDSAAAQELWALLKRRAVLVAARKQIQQSFRELQLSTRALLSQFHAVLRRIDARLQALIRALGWSDDYQRCRSIPGIGPLNAAALVSAYHRGAFASCDAFVAFLGLDVRRRESGYFKGKRKLTKRGPAELRRLLYCAAKPARCHAPFERYYQKQLDKGLPKTAANCILARKLARLAFTLMARQESFQPKHYEPCPAP